MLGCTRYGEILYGSQKWITHDWLEKAVLLVEKCIWFYLVDTFL